MTLTLLKNTGEFCRTSLNLNLLDVFSYLECGFAFLARISPKRYCVLDLSCEEFYDDAVYFDYLVKVMSARCFHCKANSSPCY